MFDRFDHLIISLPRDQISGQNPSSIWNSVKVAPKTYLMSQYKLTEASRKLQT